VLDSLAASTYFRLRRKRRQGRRGGARLREAGDLGFTHALQVDADGQHDLDDAPALPRARPRRAPCAGLRRAVLRRQLPRSRLHGKSSRIFWVASRRSGRRAAIRCAAIASIRWHRPFPVLKRRRPARGMAFDIDVMVRLIWAGAPVETVRTRVTYPPTAVSHFRMLRDNVRITLTHTKALHRLARAPAALAAARLHLAEMVAAGTLVAAQRARQHVGHALRRRDRAAARPAGGAVSRCCLAVAWFFLTGRGKRDEHRALYLPGSGTIGAPTTWNVWRQCDVRRRVAHKFGRLRRSHAKVEFRQSVSFCRLAARKRGALSSAPLVATWSI